MTTGARLVVCPTPIGNLEDITLRVLAALREADVVACEDTRRTRVLLDRYGVSAKLVSYHEHNERQRARELVARQGFDPVYGARPLKRFLQHELESRIGRALIAGEVHDGARLVVDVKAGALAIDIQNPPAPAAAAGPRAEQDAGAAA